MNTTSPTATRPILEARDVSLSFGPVRALVDVSVTLAPGEVTAIVGDNGAGKSTLVRCFSGIHRPDSGEIAFEGEVVRFGSPESAREAGIETVHQNLALVEDLTVWQNLFLNRELTRFGFLDRRRMRREAAEMVTQLAVNVPEVTSRVRRLSGGQRQAVAVARAAAFGSKVVVLDEPTAALGVKESGLVLDMIKGLRDRGLPVILISHNMPHVFEVADRIHIQRLGRCAGVVTPQSHTPNEVVAIMTGATTLEQTPGRAEAGR